MTAATDDPLAGIAPHVTAARAARRIGLPAREIVARYTAAGHRVLRVGRRQLLAVAALEALVREWSVPTRAAQESRRDLIRRRTLALVEGRRAGGA